MRLVLGFSTISVIFWWMFALHVAAEKAPQFSALKDVKLTIPAGAEAILGRAELLQPAGARTAELRHLRLRASEEGTLWISRVAELRDLNIEFDGRTEEGSSERYEISQVEGAVTVLSAGAQFVKISVRQDGGLNVSVEDWTGKANSSTIYRDGAELLVDGKPAQSCYEQGLASTVVLKANRISEEASRFLARILEPAGLKSLFERRGKTMVAVLGGEVDCTMHSYALIAMPRANPELEFVVRKNLSDGRLFVSIFREAALVPVSFETWIDGQRVRQHFGRNGIEFPVASSGQLDQPSR
jgi:hypothetical protein